jgi:DNA-binding MurR/RpiR family transcriptional regulator
MLHFLRKCGIVKTVVALGRCRLVNMGKETAMDGSREKGSVPEAPDALADRIAAALPYLSKKHKDIAHFVLDHEDYVAFASAHELGLETDTSAATVVRFCQALGYEGFQQLQEAIRAQLSLERMAVQHLEKRLEGPIANDDLLTQVFAADIRNLQRTAVLTPGDRLQAAAAATRHARQVLIVGSGLAAMLVECLAYFLQMMDVPTRHATGGEEQLALGLTFLQPEDVVVAISFRRSPRYTMKAVDHARGIGATSIGIANSELSPVIRETDYGFPVITDSVVDRPSPVAAAALLNAFVAALMLIEPEQAAKSQQQIDSTYKQSGLLDE